MNKNLYLKTFAGFILGIFFFSNYVVITQTPPDRSIDNATKARVIKTLAKHMKKSYVFEDVAEKMSADIYKRLNNGEYSKISSARAFAKKLTGDLQAISRDKHLRVRYSHDKMPVRKAAPKPTAEEIARQRNWMKQVNYGFEKVERMNGNIGYIEFRGFFGPKLGADTVASAMNFVANTDALIFDLRRNGGGDPRMVALICSYLFGDEKVHLNDLYWRERDRTDEFWTTPKVKGSKYLGKDVYVLTSKRTFSGAEEFSYNLKNLKRATIVGETTGGGAHPGTTFRLDDHFGAFISTGRAISPITKTNWEGTGVKPDIAVSKELALKTAYRMALEKIVTKTSDKNRRESISRLITKLKNEIVAMKSKKKKDAK